MPWSSSIGYVLVGFVPVWLISLILEVTEPVVWLPHAVALTSFVLGLHSFALYYFIQPKPVLRLISKLMGYLALCVFMIISTSTRSNVVSTPSQSLTESPNLGPCQYFDHTPQVCLARVAGQPSSTAFIGSMGGGPFAALMQNFTLDDVKSMLNRWQYAVQVLPIWGISQFVDLFSDIPSSTGCSDAVFSFICDLLLPQCDNTCSILAPCASACTRVATACPALFLLVNQLNSAGDYWSALSSVAVDPNEQRLISLLSFSLQTSCKASWVPIADIAMFPNATISPQCAASAPPGGHTVWPGFSSLDSWSPVHIQPTHSAAAAASSSAAQSIQPAVLQSTSNKPNCDLALALNSSTLADITHGIRKKESWSSSSLINAFLVFSPTHWNSPLPVSFVATSAQVSILACVLTTMIYFWAVKNVECCRSDSSSSNSLIYFAPPASGANEAQDIAVEQPNPVASNPSPFFGFDWSHFSSLSPVHILVNWSLVVVTALQGYFLYFCSNQDLQYADFSEILTIDRCILTSVMFSLASFLVLRSISNLSRLFSKRTSTRSRQVQEPPLTHLQVLRARRQLQRNAADNDYCSWWTNLQETWQYLVSNSTQLSIVFAFNEACKILFLFYAIFIVSSSTIHSWSLLPVVLLISIYGLCVPIVLCFSTHLKLSFWTLRLIFDTGLIIYLASFPVLLVDFVISGISALVLVWSHQISIHAIFNSAEVCRALEVIDSVGFRAWLRHDDTAMVHPVHSDVELPAVRPVPPTHNARSTVATLSRVSQNDDSPPSCQSSASTAVASDDLFRRTRLKIPLAIPGFQHATAAMPAPVKSADVYESSSSDTDISSRDSTDRELGTQISRLELAARRAATQLAARSSANASSSSSNENQSTSTIFSVLGPKSNQTAPASSSGSEILAIGSVSSNNEDTAGTYILSPRNPELRPFHPTRDLQIPIPGGEMQVDARHPKAFLLSHLGGTVAATTAASPAPGLVLRPRAPLPVAASQTTAIARPPTNSSGMQHDVGLSELRDTTISSFASQYQYVAYAVSIFFGLLFSSFLVWFVVTVSIRDYSCGSQLQLSSEVWRSAYPRIYFDDGIRQTSCGFSRVTRLDAPNMGISVLPSHLFASLPSLEFVDVSHNALSELPLSLGQRFARNLTVLLASENLISHVSPSMLFNNPSLTRFDLRGNSACDLNWSSLNLTMLPSNFALLSNCIEKLNLSNNSLGGLGVDPDVATAARVAQSVKPKLQIIGPARDRISEPSLAQSSAQDWCELGLDRCQSVAIGQDPNFWLKTLSGFNKLRVLDVSQNILMWDAANNVDLTNLISSLPIMLPSLEILNLTGNNITSFDFLPLSSMQSFPASSVLTMNPSMIAAATSAWTWPLKTLDLSNNLLTSLSCGVQYEPWLTKSTLVLRGNPISQFYCSSRPWDGPAISSVNIALLQNIPTLKIFGTQGRPITAQTLSSVFLASPGLRFLLLFSINLANLPSSLSTLSNLQLLSLRGNPLGNGIADLPFLPSLFVLSTSNTKFLSIPADISTRLPNLRRLTLVGHQLTSIPTALGAMFWQGFLHSVELTPGTTNNRFWSPLQPFDWSGLTTLLENSLGVPCHSSNEKVYCGYQCSPSSRPGVIYLGTPSQFNLPAPSTPVYPSTIVTPNEGTVTRLSVLQSFGLSTSDDPLLWFPASKIIDTNLSLTSGTIVKRYPAAMLEQLIYRPQLNRTASAMAASFASSSFRLSTPQGRASILFDDVPRSYVSFVPSGSGMFTDDGLPFNDRYPATVSSSLTWLPAATNFVDAVMPSNVLRQLFVGDEALRIHAGGALCEWKLIAPGSARIRLKLVELDLDRSPGPTATSTSYSTGLGRLCPRDFLQLFDGDSASSPSLLDRSDRICGSLGIEMPTSWTTSGSTAFVRFVSDLDDNDRGFAIAFSLVN